MRAKEPCALQTRLDQGRAVKARTGKFCILALGFV